MIGFKKNLVSRNKRTINKSDDVMEAFFTKKKYNFFIILLKNLITFKNSLF